MSSIPFVDLKAQYAALKPEIDAAIGRVIADTAFIGGTYAGRFEQEFAGYLGVRDCIGCANGTDAIEILLQALGIGPGDEVLVPAHTWISTSEAVSAIGAVPVFVDTDPKTYTIDPARVEGKITKRTKAIIPVHLYGLPAPMDEIMTIAQKHGLLVMEDCAQAHGATVKGRKVGTFGAGATFSFYPGKNLGAYGDAGAMVTNDADVAARARMIANHGQVKKHDHRREGRNSRLDGIQGAVLSVKLKHLDEWNAARRRHADVYTKLFQGSGIQTPTAPEWSQHVYHLYVIQVPDRDAVQRACSERGIETAIHYPTPLPFLAAYAAREHTPADFPASHAYMPHILSLPMFAELTDDQIRTVVSTVRSAVKQ